MPEIRLNFHFVVVGDSSIIKIKDRQIHIVMSHAESKIEVNLPNNNPKMNAAEILKKGCFLWLKLSSFSIS